MRNFGDSRAGALQTIRLRLFKQLEWVQEPLLDTMTAQICGVFCDNRGPELSSQLEKSSSLPSCQPVGLPVAEIYKDIHLHFTLQKRKQSDWRQIKSLFHPWRRRWAPATLGLWWKGSYSYSQRQNHSPLYSWWLTAWRKNLPVTQEKYKTLLDTFRWILDGVY